MTTPKIIRKRTQALTLNVDAFAARLGRALAALTEHDHICDGYPNKASGAATDGSHGTAELTSVEAAAHRNLGDLHNATTGKYRPGALTTLADMDELLHGANDLLVRLIAIVDQHDRVALAPPRCDGKGLEGWNVPRVDGGWSDPTCRDGADKAGLCSACYQRCRRWRLRTGLRPLREDADVA